LKEQTYGLGMIGLGVMGRNLVLNISDHGLAVAGYDKDWDKVQELRKEAQERKIKAAENLEELIGSLRVPRTIMMLVPAGGPVDSVIGDLIPRLEPGDLIIDGGNSHFRDTDARLKRLAENKLLYMGVGVSGGEKGARYGPSIMPGGREEAYARVRPIFEAAAAQVEKEPCVTYLGPGSAGHYVKMVHNGIEYGVMQLIAESYHILKQGLGLSDDELSDLFAEWNQKELNGYLMEISSEIFKHRDEKTENRLIDMILDEARQKGTGRWSAQDALELELPAPNIDIAVAARYISARSDERRAISGSDIGHGTAFGGDRKSLVAYLREAVYAATILTYSQGFSQLKAASDAYDYGLNLEEIARIWRGGCIIRAALLNDIRRAFHEKKELSNLLLDATFEERVEKRLESLRFVVGTAVNLGIPVPGLGVALSYMDSFRSPWLPANLIQAQRDLFGAHTYERKDEKGVFHTDWEKG
jgi:6-phosphogluconate dehydrogenase